MTTPLGRPRTFPPRKHRHRNEERVWWGDRWYSLGPAGSDKAKAEYLRLVALWQDDPYAVPDRIDDYLVPELFRDYLASGPPQPRQVERCGVLLAALHLNTPVEAFNPPALSAWQGWLCEQVGPGGRRYTRAYVSKLVWIVKAAFKWGANHQRLPGHLSDDLKRLPGPRRGQARASRKVKCVSDAHFAAVLPFLPASLRALAVVQRSTGARPSELVGLRPVDVVRSASEWTFSPASHKTAEDGVDRTIHFGPVARDVLIEHWPDADDAPFFPVRPQPRNPRSHKLWPSHAARYEREKSRRARRPVGEAYTVRGYAAAVKRACRWAGVTPAWTPYALRHTRLTEIRAAEGIEAAQAVGGHRTIVATQLYTHRRDELARKAARETG
jgi:integrase